MQDIKAGHEKPASGQRWLRVPVSALSTDALQGLLEEFASRDGTDYGQQEITLEQKVLQIRRALERGDCAIVFDENSESCQIVTRELLPDDA
ncbi:MAG: YheU family protein [Pseudomonadales bacterium]